MISGVSPDYSVAAILSFTKDVRPILHILSPSEVYLILSYTLSSTCHKPSKQQVSHAETTEISWFHCNSASATSHDSVKYGVWNTFGLLDRSHTSSYRRKFWCSTRSTHGIQHARHPSQSTNEYMCNKIYGHLQRFIKYHVIVYERADAGAANELPYTSRPPICMCSSLCQQAL